MFRGPVSKNLQLLVIQPTPFCNINCDYCYLSDRSNKARMSVADAVAVIDRVVVSGLVSNVLSVVWHAGEPLTLPVSYFEKVFTGIASRNPRIRIRHSFQTNGMLINRDWCRLFKEWDVNVGVSLDGPAWIHDLHRRDRAGRGTYERVMAGVRLLQQNDIPFHVIAVVSEEALNHAIEIFDFFVDLGVTRLGFNIEELESAHKSTSILSSHLDRVQTFFENLADRRDSQKKSVRIREFDTALAAIAGCNLEPNGNPDLTNHQTSPLAILNVAWDGSFSTFSPELMDAKTDEGEGFCFGNLFAGDLERILENPRFIEIANEIEHGRQLCSASCEYFRLCGGGAPSNKFFENGRFDSTETVYCQSVIQIPIRVALSKLERVIGVVSAV